MTERSHGTDYKGQRKGIILITSIFLVLLISTIAIGYLALVNNQLEIANSALKSSQALYCAESGVAELIVQRSLYLIATRWQNASTAEITGIIGGGIYKSKITSRSKTKVIIQSTGKMSNFQRIIQVTLYKDLEDLLNLKITEQKWAEI